MGGKTHRQAISRPDFIRCDIGQRHLGSRDQPFFIGTKQILTEFRQLTGTCHGRGIHQKWRQHLLITEFTSVDIQHEGSKCPLQPGKFATKQDKPRARHLGGSGKVHLAQRLAKGNMILWCKCETGRCSNAAQQRIVIFITAIRHRIIKDVRQLHQMRIQRTGKAALLRLQFRHPRLDFIHFGDQIIGVLTF